MRPTALPKARSWILLAVVALTVGLAALPAVAAGPVSISADAGGPQGPGCNPVYFDGEGVTIHPDCLLDGGNPPIVDQFIGVVCNMMRC